MKFLSLLLSSTILLSSTAQAAGVHYIPPPAKLVPMPVPPPAVQQVNSIIVKFKDLGEKSRGIPASRVKQVNQVLAGVGLRGSFQQDLFGGLKVMRLAALSKNPQERVRAMQLANIERACRVLKQRLAVVEIADPNYIRRAF